MEKVRIAKDSVELPMEVRKEYLQNGYQLLQKYTKDSTYLKNLSQISIGGYRLKDSLFYRKVYKELSSRALESENYMILGEANWDMASFLKSYRVIDSSYYYHQLAYQSFDNLPTSSSSKYLKARMLYGMAQAQNDLKDYLGAESNTTKAIKIFDGLDDNQQLYGCYTLLGSIQSGLKNEEKALEYYQKAGKYLKSLKNDGFKWINKNNIALTYLRKEDYKSAIEAYEQLFKETKFKQQRPELYGKALVSHTYSRFKLGENSEELNQKYLEAINLYKEIDRTEDMGRAKQYLAELFVAQGKRDSGILLAREVNQFAQETQNNDRRLEVLKFLTQIDSKRAVAYSTAYYNLSEQIKEEERATRDKFARVRLETDQIIEENEVLSRQKQIWIGVTLGLLLFGIALFTIISQRISNNRLKFQQKQQESNQEIYNLMLAQQGKFEEGKKLEQKRISEELHDGVLGQMLGIRLVLSGLNEMTDEKSVEQRGELIEKLRETEEEIRTISHELNNASYQKIHNFIVSLEDMIDSIGASSGINCSFTYDSLLEWDSLEGDIKINAYRIVQESLQNCVKHAQCKNASVNFECEDNLLKLSIKDDGRGFDINKGKRGIGLRNIISRVKKVNGTLDIESKKGEGTTIKVNIPMNYAKQTEILEDLGAKQTAKA
ncbi:tetratricopeptide repeat-containing sensor histidine kinase [Flagellimonas sp. S174]|uniref:tetratricopeptide repeat-containing sensor histidine kinase n=1 Tax=Flagellimonas sp. S174 TaxID=3410790 RepID=UPI003BF61AC9